MLIKSQQIQENQTPLYSGVFEIDRKGESKEINDSLIANETIATLRATSEFLEYGYDKQEVEFSTYFAPLKINDIIEVYAPTYRIPRDLTKTKFIVKKITHYFKDGVIKTKIKAVRYD